MKRILITGQAPGTLDDFLRRNAARFEAKASPFGKSSLRIEPGETTTHPN
ncbi:MAG: hypothetical protein R2751_15800 [Bacteroidales bacterium]